MNRLILLVESRIRGDVYVRFGGELPKTHRSNTAGRWMLSLLLRWGIAEKELNHTFTGVKLSDDPQARNYRGSGVTASPVDEDMYYQFEKRTWSAHNRYFPIPQNDLNVNKNLKQNEGYN